MIGLLLSVKISSMKEYDEVWSVKAEEVREFFSGREGDVSVIPLPDKKIGAVALPQTRVIIQGDNAEELYRQFFFRFLRGGG